MGASTTVFVAEASSMACELMAGAFRHSGLRLRVSVSASDSETALTEIGKTRPDVAIISAALPDGPQSGLRIIPRVRAAAPDVHVVALLDAPDRDLIIASFRNGAHGVFCRTAPFDALCKCIHAVSKGQIWANSEELRFVLEALSQTSSAPLVNTQGNRMLTNREEEVVRLATEGLTNRAIAAQLNLSEHTVRNYLFRIYEKLGISSRVELVRRYVASSVNLESISPPPDQKP